MLYRPSQKAKRFVIIWLSKMENGLKDLESAFNAANLKHNKNATHNISVASVTDIYLFDRKGFRHKIWENGKWVDKNEI